jgi:hypothetical protein
MPTTYSIDDQSLQRPAQPAHPQHAPDITGYCARVPLPNQGLGALASLDKNDGALAIEQKVQTATRESSAVKWAFIRLPDQPVPDAAPYTTVIGVTEGEGRQPVYQTRTELRVEGSAFHYLKGARYRDGKLHAADKPQVWETPEAAAAALRTARDLGQQLGLHMASMLSYAQIVPLSEWFGTASGAAVELKQAQDKGRLSQAVRDLEAAKARIREAEAALSEDSANPTPTPDSPAEGPTRFWTSVPDGITGLQWRKTVDDTIVWRRRLKGTDSGTVTLRETAEAWQGPPADKQPEDTTSIDEFTTRKETDPAVREQVESLG